MTTADIDVTPDATALMHAAAEQFVRTAADAVTASGRFVVALSGGSTPQRLYVLLATETYAKRVEWSRVHVFWGDERCVPPDDPQSNYRMARAALLDHVPIPAPNVHRIRGEAPATAAAAAYERELREIFGTIEGPPRHAPGARFDLVLLGMGDNGHTASLFPGLTAVRETQRWVVAEYVPEVSTWRVTLTPVVINAGAEVIFVVSGEEKATMLARVINGPHMPDTLPSQAIMPRHGRVRWLVDTAAAAQLAKEPSAG